MSTEYAPIPAPAHTKHTGAQPGMRGRQVKRKRRRLSVEPIYWFFLLPTLILITLVITVPAIVGFFFGFTNYIGVGDWDFIGLANYKTLFADPAIRQSYFFTLGFSLVTVIIVNIISFLLAVGLTAKIKFKVTLRAVFVLPMVISGIIIAYVFNFLFSTTLPNIGQALGISWLEQSILSDPNWAWLAVVIVTAWQSMPTMLLIYIAGLLSIPTDVYEAAAIDGASKWQQMMRITLPLVFGYVVINIVIGFKNYLNSYDIIVGLTGGGPGTATRSVALTIITGFFGGDYAYQMANATIFFILAIALAVLQLSLTRGRNAI
ncbi:sugar ABC transporter permease [Gleimia hominis]|uniref:Sugar ABC transporter permease n=1 Tax=Gleimia hominis TaxID=595468 RepID=A0ABU3IBM4_9ACTO|nr:sugar ABC transporter permease [Gleimia hominis]MDT3767643.1 sugar ABC transporter permease [Gleimia hominis]